MDNVVHVRRAVKHFNLSRFSLIGHSMGGGICSAFAATHPELVEHLVSLDMICPLLRPLIKLHDQYIFFENQMITK